MTPKEAEKLLKLARIYRWQNDITLFLKDVFPHHYTKPFAPFHSEIFSILRTHHRVAIAAPRKHGKSELITFGWVMWNLLLNPKNRFTIIIANNYANSTKFLTPIKEELENNKTILDYFGQLKSDKWSENEIELICKKKIIVGGNDFKIRGQKYLQYRPDILIIDDAEDDELVKSDVRREDFERWLTVAVEPAMTVEDNQIIFVGTIIHRDSQLSKLMPAEGKYIDWTTKKYEALIDNGTKAIWEEAITKDWLVQERLKDPYKFAQEYMNNPVPYEHAMFKDIYFDNYSDDKLPKDLLINFTCDLACTDKEYSDYTVILPVGVDALGDLWVLPYTRGRYIDPDQILDEMFKMYLKYSESGNWKIGKFGVEKVAFQRFLIRNLDRERKKRGLRFPIVEIDAKGDKIQRISQLQPLFASGDIHIRGSMIDLKEELLDFPRARHDDISDALAMHLNFLNNRPIKHLIADTKWKVTPEMQREKVLHGVKLNRRIKIYSRF